MQQPGTTSDYAHGEPVQTPEEVEHVTKQPFVEPKLTFVTPKLVKWGAVEGVTAGFFGTFYP